MGKFPTLIKILCESIVPTFPIWCSLEPKWELFWENCNVQSLLWVGYQDTMHTQNFSLAICFGISFSPAEVLLTTILFSNLVKQTLKFFKGSSLSPPPDWFLFSIHRHGMLILQTLIIIKIINYWKQLVNQFISFCPSPPFIFCM